MDTENHFFDNNKIQQLVIQFAFRMPARRQITVAEKKTLENVLRDLDNEVFQLFDDPQQKTTGPLFKVVRQIPIGPTTATLPAFVLANDSCIFFYPVKLMNDRLQPSYPIDAQHMNKEVSEKWFPAVQNVITNSHCQRTGKIYELILGPFTPDEKPKIFNNLISNNLDAVGEFSLTFAQYVTKKTARETDEYNIQTNLQYRQLKLEAPFPIIVRIDINNRKLMNIMDPVEIKKVWAFADSEIDNHLKQIINLQEVL